MRTETKDGTASFEGWLVAGLVVLALGTGIDLVLDRPETIFSFHVAFEAGLLAFATGLLVRFGLRAARDRRALGRAREALASRQVERDLWRARAESLLRGLGEEIDAQLGRWGLSPAERETVLLLLKGYGHKEIARLLGKSERTVRQQAASAYKKSGLAGRAELSAFFLEDLLLPRTDASR
ncbi:hypothetical protein MYXO_01486 [Myxococcaceae bacterium]|jgi:DNA-binding CsgD family transcriptional regulator|nr:hypothetical protein MYXO_01486 [Myxococcaceae bacterium]